MYVGLNAAPFPLMLNSTAMRSALVDKSEIRFTPQTNATVVCSYIVAMEGTFDSAFACEARGIVFDQNDEVISRPLHKFFNVGEREATRFENLDWTKVDRVMVKRDGSMIHTVAARHAVAPLPGTTFTFKSKKSFTSDVVKAAVEWLHAEATFDQFTAITDLCEEVVARNKTAIFEYTSPTSRIVVAYPEKALTLLHVRDNVTGEYMLSTELKALAEKHDVPLVEEDLAAKALLLGKILTPGFEDFIEGAIALEEVIMEERLKKLADIDDPNVEGWVVQFTNGDMVKFKTAAYIARHRLMTFQRRRDVAQMVLDEMVDDYKARMVAEKVDISEILEIEKTVVTDIEVILDEIDAVYGADKELSRKDFALKHNQHRLFGLIMKRYGGQELDVKAWYKKHVLDDKFDLTQINLLQQAEEPVDE